MINTVQFIIFYILLTDIFLLERETLGNKGTFNTVLFSNNEDVK